MKRRITALVLAAIMTLGAAPAALAADDDYANRGQVCDMLLAAADDYNPGVVKTDILKGYEDGQLHEERDVTRAEALVMLKRAFGDIPEIKGANKYIAIPTENFTDIPAWAKDELSDVFDAGIVAGKAEGIFAPDDNVKVSEMELFIQRMYRVFGTNLKDDFYQTVNYDKLNNISIPEGQSSAGTMSSEYVSEQLKDIIKGVSESNPQKGSMESKIKTLYDNYLNKEARNAQGYEPIKPYLDEIDAAKSVSDFVGNAAIEQFLGFSVDLDDMDSTHYADHFGTIAISDKDMYEGKDDNKKAAYFKYMKKLFTLVGYSDEDAEAAAQADFDIETQIAEASLSAIDQYDIEKTYNVYTLDEISALFKNIDISKVFEDSGLKNKDRFIVYDPGAMEKMAELLDDKNLDALKTAAKINLIQRYAAYLSDDFVQASKTYDSEVYGIEGDRGDEMEAAMMVNDCLEWYVGELYTDKYIDEKTVSDITKMITDMIDIYRERIQNLDWMSETTKEKALNKLDTMGMKVCVPDKLMPSALDDTELASYDEGGSLVENLMAIKDAHTADAIANEGKEVDHSQWVMSPQTVNACYMPNFNDITICAGIVQTPGVYSSDSSYEANLGSLGVAIGHELSHAFDYNGSQYDENGNAVNWWTDEDAAAFDERCQAVIDFYDGYEAAPGIATNGELTLTENTADMGGLSVVTELASKTEDFDYEEMYESYANLWLDATYRGAMEQQAATDYHSLSSVRVNRMLETSDKFFETYGITEGDGMWVAPEDRVSIW